MLLTCQSGYEALLARELAAAGGRAVGRGPGWVRLEGDLPVERLDTLAFAHLSLGAPTEVQGDSVNELARGVIDAFLASLQGERIEAPWPNRWLGPAEITGLTRRVSSVEKEFEQLLRRRLARVAKLAVGDLGAGRGERRGLGVFFPDFDRCWMSRSLFVHGPRRMADDPAAPSRSYLKVEEAYAVLGMAPRTGEQVVDLGAAPGGWSYSAAKRGARVIAIDNGPLKGGALDHPGIEHRREDAFGFRPPAGTTYDWLFCDLVEEPHHVIRQILTPWLEHGWCRRFVVNFKFGRVDPLQLLGELRAPNAPLVRLAPAARIHHLYHDREEFTVMGSVA